MLEVPESTLRYWEKEFKQLSPKKTAGGSRQYTQADIEQIKTIKFLVHENSLTIKGAKEQIKKKPQATLDLKELVERLQAVRAELVNILDELDATPPCGQPF